MIWKQLRISLLAFTLSGVLFVLGTIVFLPTKDKQTVPAFTFPQEVPLPQWQFTISRPLPQPTKKVYKVIAQKHYQYLNKNWVLDIEMRYLKDGDVVQLLRDFTFISSPAVVRQQQGVGYYGLGVEKQRAYLSACINPQGGSTFTNEQFNQNLHTHAIQPKRLLSWILSQEQLQDNRCLWAHLSVPFKNSSPEAAYQVLENAWFSWYRWWEPRFPKS
ncbi:MAG: cyanoexosortase A system-associated protein [Brasilonema octagenarum HA4186-MV1]|jgi:cyanosortase A-associated protein|uniref:Cyanoexosortase A system-associated protein n=1 Tax=Brasilonema sennae CENA114 TaxID=415709 RepID=A0A856MBH8_9CYAN|nr:cyanoexosortase A system-associated protein [Brasilonema sennae]MBW4626725.1 cyanoexosortase A system-associated protein [Brasilonema octagenarum HA4186-MV1]QDL07724.1 cyanoexosortase A system-associated protein [Brasilonema sennae CENA114]QDL14086.1 cyanoexosortase A system-associated protein [Brasilonema octagenarum UFV-E1]